MPVNPGLTDHQIKFKLEDRFCYVKLTFGWPVDKRLFYLARLVGKLVRQVGR
jgi:hypothetical protein